MEAVVEFHGFKDNNNKFILKEFCIVGRSYRTQIVFRPPYSFNFLNSKMKRTARWLTRHFHHIKWDDGEIEYSEELIRSLCKPFEVIHTKGLEKAQFLREFHHNVKEINIENSSDSKEFIDCIIHKNIENCALMSAKYYARKLFPSGVE